MRAVLVVLDAQPHSHVDPAVTPDLWDGLRLDELGYLHDSATIEGLRAAATRPFDLLVAQLKGPDIAATCTDLAATPRSPSTPRRTPSSARSSRPCCPAGTTPSS